MKVVWEVDDGYVGSRPHYTDVPNSELAACETKEERDELIDSYVEEDFRQRITWYRKRD